MVFRGDDGLDELSTSTTSHVWVARDGEVHADRLDPKALDIVAADVTDLRGGDAAFNANVVRRFLSGEPGPVRDAVLLNAAAALVAFDGPTAAPIGEQLAAAVPRAAEAVDTGAASNALDAWVAASQAAEHR